MSVTSASAKIKLFIGSFDYDSTLSLPATTQENKLTLEFEELISNQLTGWGDTPINVYVLLKVLFEGTEVYKNTQYDSPSTTLVPTDPDITIVPDANPSTAETATVNNFVSMVTDTAGNISSGTYTVNAKFVYWANDTAFGSSVTAFTADFSFTEKKPTITNWYDTQTPKLNVTDNQSYILGGITADRDTEFVLSPPQNGAEITNTYDNIQTVNYSAPWVGGNEVTYTVLLTYTFTDYIVVNAQQSYKSFTVYFVDNCTIYKCLNTQYDIWVSSTCNTRVAQNAWETLMQATTLAVQIINGLGCNDDQLSALINEFNTILDCDCDCLDDTPRQLGSASTVTPTNRQTVTANTATTTIDLSAGSTMDITVSINTTLDIINIQQYNNYRFIFIADGGGDTVTFPGADFETNSGSLIDRTPSTGGTLVMDFYAVTATKLTLVSDNAA
jgi:hypothetical protein